MVIATNDYDQHALQRWVPESYKSNARSEFERDRARVLHSAALRRLAAKTQVVTAGEDDFPRTRLTHSLEVAQIGRELAVALGCDPDVVDAAGLAHDLGHPPFGHTGETALNIVAEPCGGFEGNAQTLRVLTRLEPKVMDADGYSVGLNLTRSTLDAVAKYPWTREHNEHGKFGVYVDDLPVFRWLREGVSGRRRCLEAQVMDWADDVAYSVHDMEDGLHAGHIDLRVFDDIGERRALCEHIQPVYSTEPTDYLAEVLGDLLHEPAMVAARQYDGSYRAQLAVKRLTTTFVGRFAWSAVHATREHFGGASLRRYGADLVVPRRTRAECALIKGLALRYVIGQPDAERRREIQREWVTSLAHRLIARAPDRT